MDYLGRFPPMSSTRPTMMRCCLFAILLFIAALPALAQDPFALGVRETPHRSPEEEQKLFKLPPGFEIQLVAAEPEIQKPLNMAFDAKGRLWVTDTVEYPYAAPLDKPGRDSIKILEDTNNDGRADKITTFVDGLNIPIGLLPYKDGVIAHSIPNIWLFRDTDGDGKCDERAVLYGPFDHTRDTHGMENAFRRGFDGWIYACHGFNNDSHVKGADGHEVHMNSGNTFRFRPDGSRIEHFTHGQVNPFGMCIDELFNIFTADCHSKPITQLLRGGHYPSFGKPHDGLGFVPPMMDHLHGSTAICGIAKVDGLNFPLEYRGNLLSGNVMTSRINRNSLIYHGSTIKCKEEPDFLSTDDPWFRPVDLQIGPDGALYIADFYNRIIGHYEVPLPHPGRDRTSGRIWRVVYKGDAEGAKPAERQKDLTTASIDELIAELDHPVLTQRLLAAEVVVQRIDKDEAEKIGSAYEASTSVAQRVQLMWIAYRLRDQRGIRVRLGSILDAAGVSDDRDLRVHAMKLFSEWKTFQVSHAWEGLDDEDGFVARAAAQALATKPYTTNEVRLLRRLRRVPEDDAHLTYAIRAALRDNMKAASSAAELLSLDVSDRALLAPIALAVPTPAAAAFLTNQLRSARTPKDQQLAYLTHAARYAEGDAVPRLIDIVRARWYDDLDLQLKALLALQQGLAQRGQSFDALVPWAEELGTKLLDAADQNVIAWENFPVVGAKDTENPWVFQQRVSADGNKEALFYSSLVKGEQKTGILRSQPFELPERLSFWCAGHIGPPGDKTLDLNYIRLRDESTRELLAESRPPRNDVAQRIEWDLAKHKGKKGYVEIMDADTGAGYAWLAVGRFSVEGLNPNQTAQRQQAVAKLASELKLKGLQPPLAKLLTSTSSDAVTRSSIGAALVAIEPDARAAALVRVLGEPEIDPTLRRRCADAVASRENLALHEALNEAMKLVPARVQTAVAETLAGDLNGAFSLLQLIADGKAPAALLRSPNVRQKLLSIKQDDVVKRLEQLSVNLPPASEQLDKLIAERRKAFDGVKTNIERGAEVYAKNCANCHQIAGKGQVVGPQLDGIGQRGLDRIIEDVLDPNRNVDVAFRTVTLALSDGRVVSGLVRREEGEQLVVVDNQGKELRISKTNVEERNPTSLSLMPANVQEIVSPEDFQHLIGYLLQQKAKPAE